MIDQKKCKGTGIANGYGCLKIVDVVKFGKPNRKYGLGLFCGCYKDWLLNSVEGKEKVLRSTLKACETRLSLERATKNKKEENGIAAALTLTKNVVHAAIRERDNRKPCISCGCQWNDDFQAGHCYPTRYRSIRFNFHNINGQCVGCNIGKDGNETQYLINLPKRIGEVPFKVLKVKAELDSKFNKKWTKEELKQIRINAKNLNR